jgi:hypothetical protein
VVVNRSPQTVYPMDLAPGLRNPRRINGDTSGTKLDRYICISWSSNIVVAVATIALLFFVPLDDIQTVFCVHLMTLCVTCAVLVWTTGSARNWFMFSILFTVAHMTMLLFLVWNCEPLFLVEKILMLSLYLLGLRALRITGSRLVRVIEGTPKVQVRFTPVQIFLAASIVLVASLHLAFPSLEVFSFAELALWGCCLVNTLWHFGVWRMNTNRAFRGAKGMDKILAKGNASLQIVNRVRRQQNILNTVSILFTETTGIMMNICANSVLGLQEESRECHRRTSIGSDRIALFGFPISVAFIICSLMVIYMHAAARYHDQKLRNVKNKRRGAIVPLQESSSSLISVQSD